MYSTYYVQCTRVIVVIVTFSYFLYVRTYVRVVGSTRRYGTVHYKDIMHFVGTRIYMHLPYLVYIIHVCTKKCDARRVEMRSRIVIEE